MKKEGYMQLIEKVGENLNDFLYSSDERYRRDLVDTLGWTPLQAKRLACWDWTHGIGLYGIFKLYQFTKDEVNLDYIEAWLKDRMEIGLPEKNVNTVAPLLTMACVYEFRPRKEYEEIMREWAEWIMNDMKRTMEGGIQHSHAELENDQSLWDDTLMMTVLFLAKVGNIFRRSDYIEEAIYQFLVHVKYLTDTKTGLWYHGYSFPRKDHFAAAFWGRGNSWATIALPLFEELLTLTPQEVTHRLFWEEAPEYFEPLEPKFACTCSREKIEAMIRNLGEVEALQIVKDEGKLEVTCDFCGRTESFSAEDIVKLFDNGSVTKN